MRRLAPFLALAIGCGGEAAGGAPELVYRTTEAIGVGEHPVTLAVYDADGDGDADVLVPGLITPTLTVLENDGGTLRAMPPLALSGGVLSACTADLEGDGAMELVMSIPSAGEVGAWRIEDRALVPVATAMRDEPSAVTAGDVDGDGRAEIALAEAGAVSLLRGDAGSLRVVSSFAAPEWPTSVVLSDLDRDGSSDLVITGSRPPELWLAGDGDLPRLPLGTWPMGFIAANIDADPAAELIGADNLGDALIIVDLEAGDLVTRRLPSPGQPAAVAAGDLDGDGTTDLAVAAKGADRVDLWLGDGAGDFRLATSLAAGWGPTALALADLDTDGCLDLVVVNAFSNDVTTYRCQAPVSGLR